MHEFLPALFILGLSICLTLTAALVVWLRSRVRQHVLIVLATGVSVAAVATVHLQWASEGERESLENRMKSLSAASLAVVEMAETSRESKTRVLNQMIQSSPEAATIRVDFEGSPLQGKSGSWVVGDPTAKVPHLRSGDTPKYAATSKITQGLSVTVGVDAEKVRSLQDKAQWSVVEAYSAVLCLCLGLGTLLIAGLDQERVRELDALNSMLNAEQERMANLINSVKGVVWERDPVSGKFLLLSGSADGFLGYSKTRWQRETDFWASKIHESDRDRTLAAWNSQSQRPGPYEIVYRVVAADGRIAHVEEDGFCVRLRDGAFVFRGVFSDITERFELNAAAEKSRRIQVENSRQAGMAELATGVLHNVGNILNTLNVNARLMSDQLRDSKVQQLHKASKLLAENGAKGSAFFTDDPRGRALPDYLTKVSDFLMAENTRLQGQMHEVLDRIEHIRDVIVLQQKHGKVRMDEAEADLVGLVQDALRLEGDALSNGGVDVETRLPDLPALALTKSHILQILVNLINNARHAVADNSAGNRRVEVTINLPHEGKVAITVKDNGCGIAQARLAQIFSHGFTTRKDGHGFGLHHAGLLAQDMGGRLFAESEGRGKGATFVLELPFVEASKPSQSNSRDTGRSGKHGRGPRDIAMEVCS